MTQKNNKNRKLLIFAGIIIVAFVLFSSGSLSSYISNTISYLKYIFADACCSESQLLKDEDMANVANLVSKIWYGKKAGEYQIPERFMTKADGVYVALRSKGQLRTAIWKTSGTTLDALQEAINYTKIKVGNQIHQIDTVEINLSHTYQPVNYDNKKERRLLLANIYRGIKGLHLSVQDKESRYAPTYIVASNRDHKSLIKYFTDKHKISKEQQKNIRYQFFKSEQILVKLGSRPTAFLMERGNKFVPVEDVTQENTRKLAQYAANWMFNNVHSDGRMTYKYWPSNGRESIGNNMIRQWMATVALGRVAAQRNKQPLWDIAEKNIDYNLKKFYHKEGEYGVIEWQSKVKLGAMALATIALVEHPQRFKWADQEASLRKTINSLWNEDGSFNTFFKPKNRNDVQNFYPGETLLLWAILYQKEKGDQMLKRFMKSFKYYRTWHLKKKNRNPAFIPWHTQAYYIMWTLTKDEELKQFIYKMNDWLIDVMQQWEGDVPTRDALGRFHNPRTRFGAPHASSTGVYLEGLIDAFKLAEAVDDRRRREKYRLAVIRGLRSAMQLQFVDDIDMYYISDSKRKYVYGGLRTTVYNNEIRCDNIQHNLMGILKILNTFKEENYNHD